MTDVQKDKIEVTETDDNAVLISGTNVLANARARFIARDVADHFGLDVVMSERCARIVGVESWEVAHRARIEINNLHYYEVG